MEIKCIQSLKVTWSPRSVEWPRIAVNQLELNPGAKKFIPQARNLPTSSPHSKKCIRNQRNLNTLSADAEEFIPEMNNLSSLSVNAQVSISVHTETKEVISSGNRFPKVSNGHERFVSEAKKIPLLSFYARKIVPKINGLISLSLDPKKFVQELRRLPTLLSGVNASNLQEILTAFFSEVKANLQVILAASFSEVECKLHDNFAASTLEVECILQGIITSSFSEVECNPQAILTASFSEVESNLREILTDYFTDVERNVKYILTASLSKVECTLQEIFTAPLPEEINRYTLSPEANEFIPAHHPVPSEAEDDIQVDRQAPSLSPEANEFISNEILTNPQTSASESREVFSEDSLSHEFIQQVVNSAISTPEDNERILAKRNLQNFCKIPGCRAPGCRHHSPLLSSSLNINNFGKDPGFKTSEMLLSSNSDSTTNSFCNTPGCTIPGCKNHPSLSSLNLYNARSNFCKTIGCRIPGHRQHSSLQCDLRVRKTLPKEEINHTHKYEGINILSRIQFIDEYRFLDSPNQQSPPRSLMASVNQQTDDSAALTDEDNCDNWN